MVKTSHNVSLFMHTCLTFLLTFSSNENTENKEISVLEKNSKKTKSSLLNELKVQKTAQFAETSRTQTKMLILPPSQLISVN